MRDRRRQNLYVGILGVFVLAASVAAQPPRFRPQPLRPEPPPGREIVASDGDTILIADDDRVRVIRRRTAEVRVVADAASGTVLVIADWGVPGNPQPDRGVDRTWRFTGSDGTWPLEPRWQGSVTLVEPESMRGAEGRGGHASLTLETPAGPVVFMGGRPGGTAAAAPAGATVIWHLGMSGGGLGSSFDEAERHAGSNGAMWSTGSSVIGFSSEVVSGAVAGSVLGSNPAPLFRSASMSSLPVVRRVEPAWPDPSTLVGIAGMVVVQLAVAPDGSVRRATLLRSLPPVDAAVLAAVSQWRYPPAGPEGRPDPVMVTAAVPYPPR